jgi:hypothetical protein
MKKMKNNTILTVHHNIMHHFLIQGPKQLAKRKKKKTMSCMVHNLFGSCTVALAPTSNTRCRMLLNAEFYFYFLKKERNCEFMSVVLIMLVC